MRRLPGANRLLSGAGRGDATPGGLCCSLHPGGEGELMASELLALYGYWRSSAVYRVRIALNLKGLAYETRPVHLLRDGGEQHGEAYRALNPQQLIPSLRDGERVLTQ